MSSKLKEPSLSLEEHLSKFPSLSSIFPMDDVEQACFIKDLETWKEEHEKLFKAKVSQIQDRVNELLMILETNKTKLTDVTIRMIKRQIAELNWAKALLVSPDPIKRKPSVKTVKLMAEGYKDSADDDLALAKEFEGIEPEVSKLLEGSEVHINEKCCKCGHSRRVLNNLGIRLLEVKGELICRECKEKKKEGSK